MTSIREREIDQNYQFFVGHVGKLLPQHEGRYALLRHASFVEAYTSVLEAINQGHSRFGDGVFSVQEVTDKPLDLGFFSHANSEGGVRS